jgi:hypothetical protein
MKSKVIYKTQENRDMLFYGFTIFVLQEKEILLYYEN